MTEIIAEISGNHGGKLENALRLISEAKRAGADAVKFQCFEPPLLAMKRIGMSQLTYGELLALYRQTHTPKPWFPRLIHEANSIELPWFSSVFDPSDVTFLETLACPRDKISAYEMLDGDLINAVKKTGKPIVMSVRPRDGLTILKATEYGTSPYGGWFTVLGLSDHTVEGLPIHAPMIERHLRLPDVETPDAAFGSTPEEFARYVKAIRGTSR
jgi:pseudaminic acid synthase